MNQLPVAAGINSPLSEATFCPGVKSTPTICPGINLDTCLHGSSSIGGILTIAPTTMFASFGALSGSSQNFNPSPLS